MTDPLTLHDQNRLLDVAEASLREFVTAGRELELDTDECPPSLRDERATFVTLRRYGDLRGCMGSLLPRLPLVQDVAHNTYAAAAYDPRFAPLTAGELPGLHVQISLLTLPERMQFSSEHDLLEQMRPGVDGLTLTLGRHRGTLLPAVWEMCPDKRQFLEHLKRKAGLPSDFWNVDIHVERYQTICWSRLVTET